MDEGRAFEGDRAPEGEALQSAHAVRDRCQAVSAEARAGKLEHWTVDEAALPRVVERVLHVIAEKYPDARAIPYLVGGGISRWAGSIAYPF